MTIILIKEVKMFTHQHISSFKKIAALGLLAMAMNTQALEYPIGHRSNALAWRLVLFTCSPWSWSPRA